MKIIKNGCSKLTLGGVNYTADEHGIIEVPDDKMNDSVWGHGFVSAQSRLKALAVEQAAATPVIPQPAAPVAAKIVDKVDVKLTQI